MDRNIFWALVAFAFVLAALSLAVTLLAPFWISMVWAVVLGITTYPVYERIRRSIGGREGLASGLMILLVLVVFVTPSVLLVSLLADEVSRVYLYFGGASEAGKSTFLEGLRARPDLAPWFERAEATLLRLGIDFHADIAPAMKTGARQILGFLSTLLRNALESLVRVILMVFLLFFVYRDGRMIEREVLRIVPFPGTAKETLRETVRRVVQAVFFGIFGTCLIQGILGGIGFWISGLPSPVLFGSLMAITALIPLVGTSLIWLPGAIYLLIAGSTGKGIFLLLWGTFAVSSADNLVRPILMSSGAQVSFLAMTLGAIGGFLTLGITGVIVGPILFSVGLALFEMHKAGELSARQEPAPGPDG